MGLPLPLTKHAACFYEPEPHPSKPPLQTPGLKSHGTVQLRFGAGGGGGDWGAGAWGGGTKFSPHSMGFRVQVLDFWI